MQDTKTIIKVRNFVLYGRDSILPKFRDYTLFKIWVNPDTHTLWIINELSPKARNVTQNTTRASYQKC